ncbi:MAG TPA: tRNA glutamyl-Q(34) synthetase GluQRS [Tepidisphaeraceae bacterium]|nr:tRNA glutamyl-Q(34) synthetase GluQRS [Tepidisphaeraceae bacterium]
MHRVTRLAPSPTGALHLGNARTFLVNWLLARQQGWRIILRIEDLDGPRIKHGADQQAIDDLRWLGIDWDEGPVYQSARQAEYDIALQRLIGAGRTFLCICSRKDVESAASAPHASDGSAIYPGTCRNGIHDLRPETPVAVRFRVPDEVITFDDVFAGRQSFAVARQLGDFVIAKSDGTAAYQLAVVVDDAAMGITDIVRGDDLLDSTPRQLLLYRALELSDCIPNYFHLPLVLGPDGRRLAKRHGDTRLATCRDAGISAGRVLKRLASWCGIEGVGDDVRAADLVDRFEIARLPRAPIAFDPGTDAALRLEAGRS